MDWSWDEMDLGGLEDLGGLDTHQSTYGNPGVLQYALYRFEGAMPAIELRLSWLSNAWPTYLLTTVRQQPLVDALIVHLVRRQTLAEPRQTENGSFDIVVADAFQHCDPGALLRITGIDRTHGLDLQFKWNSGVDPANKRPSRRFLKRTAGGRPIASVCTKRNHRLD